LHDRLISRRAGHRPLTLGLLLGASLVAMPGHAAGSSRRDTVSGPLSVHMRSDRMTLRVAKAPQVYLAGSFNAEAVEQVRKLQQSGKLPPGADVYLDSPVGDTAAGMEMGKLFRAARLNTHLGAWRERSSAPARPATCLDACAYAWLGGVYRWAPSGADRIGLHESLLPDNRIAAPGAPSPETLRSYLESMDVPAANIAQVLTPASDGIVWWKSDQLLPWQVANNGRLPLGAAYQPQPGAPKLVLTQTVRGNQNQVTLQCAPGQITLAARYAVGDSRARDLAARAMYAYFEVGEQPWQPRQGERPRADGDALVFTRQMPFAELTNVLRTVSLGVWTEITGSPVRLGFWVAPAQVEKLTQPFFTDCQALQPGHVPPKAPAEQAKPSFWKKVFGHKP